MPRRGESLAGRQPTPGRGDCRCRSAAQAKAATRERMRSSSPERQFSQAELAERCVIVRTAAERPVELALGRSDREVVDAGDPPPHQPVLVELPVLIAV